MVTSVSATSSYLGVPSMFTMHQQERVCAMQKSLSLATAEEREALIEAIREFLSGFKAEVKEQIITKYFKEICFEIS